MHTMQQYSPRHPFQRPIVVHIGLHIVTAFLYIYLGVYISSMRGCPSTPALEASDRSLRENKNTIHLQTVPVSFEYNRTFGEDPSIDPNSKAAWSSIFPLGQGTVHFPNTSNEISTLSAFHQLHCLRSIHKNYYHMMHDEAPGETSHAMAHMRHCFDYLRQSLMCAADSTLEPVVARLGGVTGWGTDRKCRNFGELFQFAERWRVSNDKESPGGHR